MTLLEQYNQRKGAETGKPASASAQTKPTVNKPRTLLEAYQQNKAANTIQPVYSRVQPQSAPAQPGTLLEAYQQNLYTRALQPQQPQNLYAQAAENAARGIGGLLGEIYDVAEDRQSNLYSGAYAQILRRGDYAQQSGAGESRLNLGGDTDRRYDYINDINGYRARVDEDAMLIGDTQRMGKYAFMTKDEVGVYNYLYATQGRNAADSYLDELEPELDKQWYSGMRASTLEDAMQSSADKAWYSAMSVLQQPIRSVNSAMQNLEDALDTAQGREINPYSELRQASRLTQDVRGEIAGQMSDVGSFAYQTAMSAGDSAVNAIIAKGLGGLTGAEGDALMKATNLIGSLTMSSEVMSLAVAENKEKGYSDAGALALGLIRGAVEYASEAMGGEWVIKNVKKNPMNFVKTMVLNMIPEGVEEVMSDAMNGAVNLLVDQIFGTEESGWPKLINDFKANGTEWQKKNPELAAMLAILGEEGLSFLGGAFATFGSSGVQYTTNRASISRTAQQLHTSAENVAQLMETYDAESAGQIEALAQIFDADSVEDFTRKMADNRTAEAALDAVMRGQENENAAPEGTADMEGVFDNAEQSFDRGSENGNADLRTGGEGIDNEGRARALQMDAGNEGGQRSDRFQDLVREEVTPAALGVANGSAGQTVQVLDESRFEAGSPEAQAARRARQNGLEPVFIKGTMQVGEGENAKQARAYIVGNRVMLQADGNVNADQLLNHELYHQAAQRDPRLNDMIRSALAENMTEEELGALVDRYIQAYDGVYDFSSMTAEQIAAICEEELFADLYAGIDNTGRQELRESAQRGFSEAQNMQPQNVEAERDTRGPPEGRYSINAEDGEYEVINGPDGQMTLRRLSDGKLGNPNSNAYILAQSIPSLEGMEAVVKVKGNEVDLGQGSSSGNILAFFNMLGNSIYREGFGDVALDKYGAKSVSAKAHFPTRAKFLSIASVPAVIQKGKLIHSEFHNGKQSYTFAAPVDFMGKPVYVAAVVHEVIQGDGSSRHKFYLDEVVDAEGYRFNIDSNKKKMPSNPKADHSTKSEDNGSSRASSNAIISDESENSNPQNEGRASVEVGGEGQTLDELRREYRERTEAYTRANEANDPDFDYAGEIRRINELERMIAGAPEEGTGGSLAALGMTVKALGMTDKAPGKTQNMYDEHPERGPIGKDGLRTCKDVDAMRDEINEIGGARLKNNTGEYKAEVRRKGDGHYLCTIDRNGKRDVARTFGVAEEAAEWAAGYVDAQSRAREDAELDRHKSEQKPEPTITEQLFGQTNPRQEAKRRKSNSAAAAAAQTLQDRIRRTQEEINALNRLEKTTGLTEEQKSHRADLQETLEIMNDELTSRKSKRGEKQDSDRVEVTGNKPTQSVAAARREIMDQFHIPAGMRKEVGDAIQQRLDEMLQAGRVTEESRQALFNTLMDAGVVPKQAEPTFRQIREDLSGRRIYVSDKERADFGDNWKGLYQRAWGDRIFLTSDPSDMKIDAVNRELADVYGENRFPTDASLTDMLENMLDLAAKGRTTQQGIREAVADEAHYSGVSADQIYSEMFSDMDTRLRSFAKEAGLEVALKDKAASDMASERKRWEDRMERQAQRRRESKVREKVLKGLQRLERLRGKAAPDVRAQVDEVLKDIDTQARSITPYGLENLQALQTAYEEKAKQEGFIDDENPGNFLRNPYVEEKLARLSKMHLDEMDIGDVIELGRVVSGLENSIRTANQMIGEEFDATIKETAEGVKREVQGSKGAKPGFFQKWFREEQLSPRRFLEMLGGWKDGKMRQLARSLEDGQTRMLDFQRRAAQSFDDFMSKEENRKWLETASGKKAKWSTYGVVNGMAMDGSGHTGQSIEITPMMKIALYLHSLNEDNLRHIQTGGLVIPNKALYQQGKIQEAYAQGEHVKMQPEAVRAIASTLTQQEKTFAGYLQKFFNQQSKEAINEVSMQLDGFERAGVDNYFPIESSRSYLASDVAGEARAQTVEGIGSIANERVHAGNPIVLSDASDVLMRQIEKVSRYYGFAIPIRNFQAVNNYVFHEEGNAFAGSIKDTINRKWGAGAENYITKMLADLQSGGKRSDMMGSALAKLRGNLAGATLMVNPSVAVSQVASYTGAAQVVGWDGLAAGLAGGRVDPKLIEKYTPLYWYRNQGNSTQELGDAIKDKGLEQKLPWAMNWIQKMDSATIRRLWAAAEYRVKKDNPDLKPGSRAQIDAGTDAYYKKVAEVFNRAVYDTQPNYTNMERAQILRSDSDLTKFLTMYKTVPLQYYGMMTEAVGRLRAAMQGGTESEKAAARKYAADTFAGLMMANSVYVAVKALFKGLRKKDDDYRDEEGNLTAGSAGKQLGKDLAEVYAGSVIGGAEAYSALQALMSGKKWHGPEMSALTHVEDIVNGVGKIYTAIDDDDPRAAAGAAKAAALNVAMAFGFPAKNVETYLMAMIRWAKPEWGMEYDNLFGGISKSDLSGMDTEAAGTAVNIIMRNRTGVSFGRETTDELARLYGEGFRDAVPAAVPEYYTVNGERVEITDRAAYGEAWGGIVGDQLEELMTSDDYRQADDKTRKAMLDRLYDYATVQARKACDPAYSVTGNSTYGWTDKADAWLNAGVPLSSVISMMMSNGEASSFTITDQEAYSQAWNSVVNDGLKPLISSADYRGADDDTQNSMVNRLYQYATVQARLSNDPGYDVSNSSTYSWTLKADMCVDAGISLPDTIRYMTAIGSFTADKDENGKSISGSKKEKVVAYIDSLDLTDEQKDLLYMQFGGYKENTLASTPWHDGSSGRSSGRRGRRGGGRRSRRGSSRTGVHRITSGRAKSSVGSGIDISELFGGGGSGKKQNSADASEKLLEIVNRYYGGDEWAAAMDGGRKARTSVDFKL